MIPFRDKVPKRRSTPTQKPAGNNWSQHKPDLKEDFNDHCAYCHSYDGFRHTYFEVDHFIPKAFFLPLGNISVTQYSNLVYSCKFCNNSKRAKWPSQSETIFNHSDKGFVDPCDNNYDSHFYRTNDGGIMWRTALGKWMFSEAFSFDKRQNSIKALWNLNRLRKIIDAIIVELKKLDPASHEYKDIKMKLGEFTLEYYVFHQELIAYYNQ